MSFKFITLKLSDAMMPAMARVFRTIQMVAHKRVMSEPNPGSTASSDSIPIGLGRLLILDTVDEKG